mmetsp:Transcript_27707/g.81413  ORF Transcript_27707/g.81413 Transcript_27707/m.81413 type:complete len:191 (+) Transcript_27707:901-1473(+)
MESRTIVPRRPDINVLGSTWALKCKRYPDGRVRKLNAWFCVRGDQQIAGVDFFDTYAPVVSWQAVRLLLILLVTQNMVIKQVDYTAAFVHAPLGEDEHVYVEMPRGFAQDGYCLKLRRYLYGLRQSPKNFFDFLSVALQDAHVYLMSRSRNYLFTKRSFVWCMWTITFSSLVTKLLLRRRSRTSASLARH